MYVGAAAIAGDCIFNQQLTVESSWPKYNRLCQEAPKSRRLKCRHKVVTIEHVIVCVATQHAVVLNICTILQYHVSQVSS